MQYNILLWYWEAAINHSSLSPTRSIWSFVQNPTGPCCGQPVAGALRPSLASHFEVDKDQLGSSQKRVPRQGMGAEAMWFEGIGWWAETERTRGEVPSPQAVRACCQPSQLSLRRTVLNSCRLTAEWFALKGGEFPLQEGFQQGMRVCKAVLPYRRWAGYFLGPFQL